ncbi:hypothetical protein V5799_024199 [Amblyomma americanum]|uniref:Uncharacterized protein n=1 Tax=Amblyomma americanum TaxID=6943 RepID=A0AAQ4ECQ5_AMBAM
MDQGDFSRRSKQDFVAATRDSQSVQHSLQTGGLQGRHQGSPPEAQCSAVHFPRIPCLHAALCRTHQVQGQQSATAALYGSLSSGGFMP